MKMKMKMKGRTAALKSRRHPFNKRKSPPPPPPSAAARGGVGSSINCWVEVEDEQRKKKIKNASDTAYSKVDEKRQRIRMKKACPSDVHHGLQSTSTQTTNDELDDCSARNGSLLRVQLTINPSGLSQAELGPSTIHLHVSLGDLDASNIEHEFTRRQDVGKLNESVAKRDRQLKRKAKGRRECEISASEERLLQKDVPMTADEFEKLVRSSPNSSFVWIKYMAFMLSLEDIEKARSTAERALRTINIRDEGERLNVWIACLNLENEYGSPPEDSVRKTFERALQHCDSKKLHLALLGMYERTRQFRLVDELLERMVKRFRNSCKVWLRCVQNLLNQDKEGIQSVVNRSLLSLPQRKHIKFISKTAMLEFKCGVPDRGRSMFESILREYPKRIDLWSVYLDQEIRLGDVDLIRALFERATCSSLPPKKMKLLCKKYLRFEKTQGDEDRIGYVKRKALEYSGSWRA